MKNFFRNFIIINLIIFALLNSCVSNKNIQKKNNLTSDTLNIKQTEKIPQNNDENSIIVYKNKIYKKNIKTVLLYRKGWELAPPIIRLNEKLILSFDDLNAGVKNYKYTFIHCNADWTESDIMKSDFIDGFTEDEIIDYSFSFNTTQSYTHYKVTFPNDNIKITKSGNYIVKVYDRYEDDENLAFVYRFMVLEPKVKITAKIKRATAIEDRNYKQEVDFKIFKQGYNISNVYQNLKVVVIKNQRWDNAITGLKPLLIKGDELDYNYDNENVFNGGNEFRHFSIKSLEAQSDRTRKIIYTNSGYNVYLYDDNIRQFKIYYSDNDINGKMLVKTEDADNSDTEADYAHVHFSLKYNNQNTFGKFYVMGALTNWTYSDEAILKFNPDKKLYQTSLYLKQGYYDYNYVFLEDGKNAGDETFIEGNHYETENDYYIFVYYRENGDLYDRLIGAEKFNSINNN